MRTIEEKEKIVTNMINNNISINEMGKKYNISTSVLHRWYYSYKENGIDN